MVKSGISEGEFEVWDTFEDRRLSTFHVPLPSYAYFERVAMDGRGELVLLAVSDATGALIRVQDGRTMHRLQRSSGPTPHSTYTRGVALSDDGTLAALGVYSDCHVFCTLNGALLGSFAMDHPRTHHNIFPFTWKGRLACRWYDWLVQRAGGRDLDGVEPSGIRRVFRKFLDWLPRPIPHLGSEITALDISGCNGYLFAASESHFHREWDLASGRLVSDSWTVGCQEKGLPAFRGRGGFYGYQCDVRATASFRPAVLRASSILTEGFRFTGVSFYALTPPYPRLAERAIEDGQILAAGVREDQPLVVWLSKEGSIEILRDLPKLH
jgi:hypothetical protein